MKTHKTIGLILCLFISFLMPKTSKGQEVISLDALISYAQENAPETMRIKTSKENKYWQWREYKAAYKPQLLLSGTLPSYQNENIPLIQDDGSIVYRNINQNQLTASLKLEQNISLTGGTLYLSSDIGRLDDFSQDTKSYSGAPFFVGYEQSLFGFNEFKWMNRIEPLLYEESFKEYTEGLEKIAYTSTVNYFNLLLAQENYQSALSNKNNADTNYAIGMEKYALGKISKDELLLLKYGLISAQKAMAQAELDKKTAALALASFSGINYSDQLVLRLPTEIDSFAVDDSLAVEKAFQNSRQSIEFKRKTLEARRDEEKARRESGLNAHLSMSYGKTSIANNLGGVYQNPRDMQTLELGLTIPILDWGRTRAKRKTALANLQLTEYTVAQEKINFRQEVITETENFKMLLDFIQYTAAADKTAAERFQIARLRYLAGDISLTDYNIAQDDKDRSKQDYILALRDYWLTYYFIRILTLYDFNNNTSLIAPNYAQELY